MSFNRESRGYLVFGTFLFVVLEILLVVAIIWWPSFEKNIAALKEMAGFLPMLVEQLNIIETIGVPGYVVAQHYFKACNALGTAAAVLFAMGAIAGEAQRGTMEIWLARPVTRRRLYTERYLYGMLALWIPVFLSSFTIPALLGLVDESMGYRELALCSLHQSLFLGSIYSVTFMLSAFGSAPIKIAFVMLFGCIFEFALYMVKTLTHWSAFRLSDIETYARILSEKSLDWPVAGGIVGITLISYWCGLAVFQRRTP